MKKIILLLMVSTSLFAFSAGKNSKKSRKTKKARITATSKKTGTKKKDAMNIERFSFHDLVKYPDRPAPQNQKRVKEEYFKKYPSTRPGK
jgi:hypothetical protein